MVSVHAVVVCTATGCGFPDPTIVDDEQFGVGGNENDAGTQKPSPTPGTDAGTQQNHDAKDDGGVEGGVVDPVTPRHPTDGGPDSDAQGGGASETCPGTKCKPEVIAENQGEVLSLAADDLGVYFLTRPAVSDWARLRYVGKDQLTHELYGTLSDKSVSLCLDSMNVFFGKSLGSGGGVFSTGRTSTQEPKRLLTDAVHVVKIDAVAIYYQSATTISRLPKSGGSPLEVAPAGSRLLLVDGDYLIVLERQAVTGKPSKIRRVQKNGQKPFRDAQVLLDQAPEIESMTADEVAFYYSVAQDARLYRLDRNSETPVPIAKDEALPRSLRSDKDWLYWVNDLTKELRAMPKRGADAKAITLDRAAPETLSIAGGNLYYAAPETWERPEPSADVWKIELDQD